MSLASTAFQGLAAVVTLARTAFREWVCDRCDVLAAAMAFGAFLALPPFVAVVLILATRLLGEEWTGTIFLPALLGWVGPRGAAVLRLLLERTGEVDRLSSLGIVSSLGLVLGGSAYFLTLQDALMTIWDVRRETPGFRYQLRKRLKGLLYALVSAVIVFAGLIAGATVLALHGTFPRAAFLAAGALVAFLTFWALASFGLKALLPVRLTWRQVLPWSALIAALHLLGRLVLSWHIGSVRPSSEVDVAAALVLVLFWVYYAGMVFLYGAQLMRVYLQRYGGLGPSESRPPAGGQG